MQTFAIGGLLHNAIIKSAKCDDDKPKQMEAVANGAQECSNGESMFAVCIGMSVMCVYSSHI